uniref:Cyclic nucleotide-binding protein n=1 Tax=Cyanothece sp. (strain PCC 7425 / ATCC 29141) TaxID=395961 RepID=B8HWS4_CYAP4
MPTEQGMIPHPQTLNPLDLLKSIPIFRELETADLEQIVAGANRVRCPAGRTIIQEGEVGHWLYLLLSGRVQVHLGDLQLTELAPGAFFGEISLFDAQPRSATVTALEDCECLVISEQQIFQVICAQPVVAIAMIKVLAERVRELNRLFLSAEEIAFSRRL